MSSGLVYSTASSNKLSPPNFDNKGPKTITALIVLTKLYGARVLKIMTLAIFFFGIDFNFKISVSIIQSW